VKTPHTPISRVELALLLALAVACLVACFGPAVAQHAHYHAFADQRAWWHVPFTMDVLSNVPFAVGGIWGLIALQRVQPAAPMNAQRCLAALFFGGLILTSICSGLYHWQPDNAGLVVDRLGMVVAFAGLLGLAAAERVSARAGWVVAGTVLLLGPLTVGVWANTGNLLPWAVLQGGGMLLIVAFALCKPASGAWGIRLSVVIAVYTLAKVLELGDHMVFEWTHGLISGHSLKHAVAALAAWPVIAVMHNHASIRQHHTATVWA
jgi:hypothetical protein